MNARQKRRLNHARESAKRQISKSESNLPATGAPQATQIEETLRRPPSQPRSEIATFFSEHPLWLGVAAFSVLITVGLGAYQMRPIVSIKPASLLNPNDPYSAIFSFFNGSMFQITNVEVRCQDHQVIYSDGETLRASTLNTPTSYSAAIVAAGAEFNIPCPQLAWHGRSKTDGRKRTISFGVHSLPAYDEIPVSSVDVELSAQFHYAILFFVDSDVKHCFSTQRSTDGLFHWFEQPCKPQNKQKSN